MSGQFPLPVSCSVHVTGSPTAAEAGTSLDRSLKSPTAPEKPAAAGGRGRTSIVGTLLITENCWYCRCWKKPNPVTPTFRFTSWLTALSWWVPGVRTSARVW